MGKILSYYTKYLKDVPAYNKWNAEQKTQAASEKTASLDLQKKAKSLAEPLLLLDKYEHEKSEDSETFYQTFNIELMSIAGLISSLPIALTKLIPVCEKYASKNEFFKKSAETLNKYAKKTIGIASKKIPLPRLFTIGSTLISAAVFAAGIKHSMSSQLGIIRKASFDATNDIIDNPKYFAALDESQQNQVDKIVSGADKSNSAILNKLKDKMNLNSSFQTVGDYRANHKKYDIEKEEYFDKLKDIDNWGYYLDEEKNKAKEDKTLLTSYLKNVEHDVLDPLRKVETISNISYSAMFTGGFLEYLITDKLVDVLGIKSKPLQVLTKIGAPLLTYLLLNKNISDIENKAILATKYKYLKKFCENPLNYSTPNEEEKQSLPEFIKTVANDMKDYNEFSEKELPKIEERLSAKTKVKLSKEQMKDAKRLQKNTKMAINKQREHLYNQSVGIKAFSESILGPIDILSTAIGAKLGSILSTKFPNVKSKKLFVGLGAIVAFIPAAFIEAKLTKQQKLAEKTAVKLSLDELNDNKQFAMPNFDNENKSTNVLKNLIKS